MRRFYMERNGMLFSESVGLTLLRDPQAYDMMLHIGKTVCSLIFWCYVDITIVLYVFMYCKITIKTYFL